MRMTSTAVVVVGLLCSSGPAAAADRLSDAQVTQLVQNIDRGFDHWKDDLERRNMDDAVIRSAAGTIDVRRFLNDMEKEIDLVKDRLNSNYAASPEVTTLLRRASDVERRAQTEKPSEAWRTLGGQFQSLAAAYGVGWPLEGSANALRKMDKELAADAKRLSDSVDKVRNGALRAASNAKRPQTERDAADREMRELKQAAAQLESNLKNHRAVATDATRVLDLAAKAQSFAKGVGPLPGDATAALSAIGASSQAIAVGFGIKP
jgi:hypothetical protein